MPPRLRPEMISYLLLACLLAHVGAVYLNSESESSKSPMHFKDDEDVMKYLSLSKTDVMLWRCENAITKQWTGEPFDYIELYCEVLGRVQSIDVFHNWKKVRLGRRVQLIASPHHSADHVFTRWMDFRVRIHKATRKDAGAYIIRVKSPMGNREQQLIFLDISKPRRKSRKDENETVPRRERRLRKEKRRRARYLRRMQRRLRRQRRKSERDEGRKNNLLKRQRRAHAKDENDVSMKNITDDILKDVKQNGTYIDNVMDPEAKQGKVK